MLFFVEEFVNPPSTTEGKCITAVITTPTTARPTIGPAGHDSQRSVTCHLTLAPLIASLMGPCRSCRRVRCRSLLLTSFVVALGEVPVVVPRAGAQPERKLELHVIDSLSGAPVENAEIRVIKTVKDTAGWMIRRSTDTSGHAVIAVPNNEHLLMLVRRLGYSSSLVQVSAANENDDYFVALAPTALALGTTVTIATPLSRRLTETGFYERQRINPGIFLDSAAIAARKPLDIIAVVRPYIKNACTVAYLDGLPLVDTRDIDIKRVVGVEFYASTLEAPVQFRNPMDSEHRCATVLIWRQEP